MKQFKGKAIYTPKNKASEYAKWACNFYVGCSNGCTYCYCKKGILKGVMGQDKPQLKSCFEDEGHTLEVFEKELKKNLSELQEHGLFFSFTTDPMLPECSDLTWRAVMFAMENDVPVKILTKIVGVWVDQLIEHMHDSWKELITFGFTLTGHDELESEASTNAERIEAMKKLHNAGFKTWASIEPIIDIRSSSKMIAHCLPYCDLLKIGLMSGKRYTQLSLKVLIKAVLRRIELDKSDCKIYFKDSFLKQAGISREELPSNCIDTDYNIFKELK